MVNIKMKQKRILWNGLCVLSVVVLISFCGSRMITGWSSCFGLRAFYVMSESMEPEIMTHQLILGSYISDEEELEIGKIYVYRRNGALGQELIVHRLLAITEDGKYQFKGDNNDMPDSDLVEKECIGYRIILY